MKIIKNLILVIFMVNLINCAAKKPAKIPKELRNNPEVRVLVGKYDKEVSIKLNNGATINSEDKNSIKVSGKNFLIKKVDFKNDTLVVNKKEIKKVEKESDENTLTKTIYVLQIGAFKVVENAEKKLKELQARFPKKNVYIADDTDFYRVYIGKFDTEEEAKKFATEELKESYLIKKNEIPQPVSNDLNDKSNEDKPLIKLDNNLNNEVLKGKNYALFVDDNLQRLFNKEIFIFPDDNEFKLDNSVYRGKLDILCSESGTILAINQVAMEDYLLGVVPNEMPSGKKENLQASKAQAVAARTYAYSRLIRNFGKNKLFDLMNNEQSQVYKGKLSEKEISNIAVKETKGEIMLYDGELVDAVYHSTCGGATKDAKIVWGRDFPYLKSVKCSYCKISPLWKWYRQIEKSKLSEAIGCGEIKNIDLKKEKTKVEKVIIKTDDDKKEFKLGEFNKVLNNMGLALPSSTFTISEKENYFIINGKGFGHGVGMCQFGALEQSKLGKNYKSILKYYYKGVYFEKIY